MHSEASEDLNLQAVRFKSLRAKIQIYPKDNAKVRHAGSGNARMVPHSSAWFRKGPICSVGGCVIINFLDADDVDDADFSIIPDHTLDK